MIMMLGIVAVSCDDKAQCLDAGGTYNEITGECKESEEDDD